MQRCGRGATGSREATELAEVVRVIEPILRCGDRSEVLEASAAIADALRAARVRVRVDDRDAHRRTLRESCRYDEMIGNLREAATS
jgi:hypothetical protein